MDSKVVNKAVKKSIWPFLKEEGFSRFTPRNAWRFNEDTIEVISFQSFNSFNAGLIGCTTYSFAVNLGIYFTKIPRMYPNSLVKEKDGLLVPDECECHLRKALHKSLSQLELERKSIWYINEAGDNVEMVINDIKQTLIVDGLIWFQEYSQMETVLATLLNEDEYFKGIFGMGGKNSPIRNYTGAYIAYLLKRYDLAKDMFNEAINSGCFKAVEERLRQDYEAIKDI